MKNIKNKTLTAALALSLGLASTLSAQVVKEEMMDGFKNKANKSVYETHQKQFVSDYTKD